MKRGKKKANYHTICLYTLLNNNASPKHCMYLGYFVFPWLLV